MENIFYNFEKKLEILYKKCTEENSKTNPENSHYYCNQFYEILNLSSKCNGMIKEGIEKNLPSSCYLFINKVSNLPFEQ